MSQTVNFRGTRDDLRRAIEHVRLMATGQAVDAEGIARGIQLRIGVAALSQIQQDFITKSRGGVGRDGIKWQPLKRETIAQRRTGPGELKSLGVKGKRVRGLLTSAQDKRWRSLFFSRYSRLRLRMDDASAKAEAAKFAWGMLKKEGAVTKLALLGGRTVDILRDTGELLRSFSPGVADRPSGAEGQVFRIEANAVIVGSNKKPWHHRGIPGKLPARPFWPLDGSIPDEWWAEIHKAAVSGIARAITLTVQRWRRGI